MVLDKLDHPLFRKMEEVTFYLINPEYSYKQVSTSFFVNHGLQMLTIRVLIVLFESLGHFCNSWYFKPTISVVFGGSRSLQNGQSGVFCY